LRREWQSSGAVGLLADNRLALHCH
jgi:hypothetical protein